MPRLFALLTRFAWGVSAMLMLSAVPSEAESPPTLPLGLAESPEFRARLDAAAADSTLEPWQREFMRELVGGGAAREAARAAPTVIGTANVSGEWDPLPPPTPRYLHTAIYDSVRDRIVVFGGVEGFVRNDVWVLNLSDMPAWTALNPTGALPPRRYGHSAVYDAVRGRMVVFGGYDGSGFRNDIWALSLDGAPAWSELGPTGALPPGRYGHSAIYDPVRDRMVVFGGYDGSVFRNDLWALSLGDMPAWSALDPGGSLPPGRYGHSAIYDPVRDRMVVFGGHTGSAYRNDVWTLSLSGTSAWSELNPTGALPPGRYGHSAIYDPVRERMVVFGGHTGSAYRNDVWAVSFADTPAWVALNPTGSLPIARYAHSAIYDPVRDRMVVFGGYDGSVFRNDLWALSLGDMPAWSALDPGGSLPPGRWGHTAIYDPVRDRMVVFGGDDGSSPPGSDVWTLSLTGNPVWSALSPTGALPSRQFHTAIYDPVRDRVVVFGGYDGFGSNFNDIWTLSLAGAPAWSELNPTGSLPIARYAHSAIYDPVRDRMVVFGGYDGSAYPNDIWALSFTGIPSWIELNPTGSLPIMRYSHSAIYDPVRDRMVVFAGYNSSAYRNDVWALSLAGTPAWIALSPAGIPPSGRASHTAIYDPVHDRMVIFAGWGGSSPPGNDVWALSLAGAPAWSELIPARALPPGRSYPTAIYDPVRDHMVVFGGYDGSLRNDVWRLNWGAALIGIQQGPPMDLRLGSPFPNPTRDGTSIRFDLPVEMLVRMTVYDVSGRLVQRVADRSMSAGSHTLSWSTGRGGKHQVPSGLYFCRVWLGDRAFTRTVVVVR